MSHLRRAAGAAAFVALLVPAAVVLAPAAAAHDALEGTDPAGGAVVATAPPAITLTFDKPALALGTEVRVTGPGGGVVSGGPPRLVDATVTQDLVGTLAPGAYVVIWRVTSADGHPVSGTFGFTAEAGGRGALSSAPPVAPAPTSTNARTAGADVGLWASAGAVVAVAAVVALAFRRRRPTRDGT